MKSTRRLLVVVAALSSLGLGSFGLSGCIYRMPVQQGNFLEDREINQITLGMTRTQVRYLLGTPMVADPFTNSRWDYVYTLKQGRIRRAERRHFIVHFDGEKVVKLEHPDKADS
jgi:outer membrane protein assembly factor BamE